MYAAGKLAVLGSLFFVILFSCYNGELILYVHADNSQDTCPLTVPSVHCRLISEYATDSKLSLDFNTSFVFLPGRHVLDSTFRVHSYQGVSNLTLRPLNPGLDGLTSISIGYSGWVTFCNVTSVSISFLEIHPITHSESIKLNIIAGASIQNCYFTNGTGNVLGVSNSSLLFSGNKVSQNIGQLIKLYDSYATLKNNSFSHLSSGNAYFEEVLDIDNSLVTILNCSFTNSMVTALSYHNSSVTIRNCSFTNSTVTYTALGNFNSSVTIQNCFFTKSTVTTLEVYSSSVLFSGNQVSQNLGQWVILFDCNATLKDNLFFHSPSPFTNASFTAGLDIYKSSVTISGETLFQGYKSNDAAAGVYDSVMFLSGMVVFEKNRRAIVLFDSRVIINGSDLRFRDNYHVDGGAIYAISSTISITLDSNLTFINNSASNDGGALYLTSESAVLLNGSGTGSILFRNNHADKRGGAVFIRDTIPTVYCSDSNFAKQPCSFGIVNYNPQEMYQTTMHFFENSASDAGGVIYGGAVDSCILNSSFSSESYAGSLFDQLFNCSSESDNRPASSPVSSDPYAVCLCSGSEPNFTNDSISCEAYPGTKLEVSLIAYGQRNGSVPATIIVFEGDDALSTQNIPARCSKVTLLVRPPSDYADTVNHNIVEFKLFASGPCHKSGTALRIKVEILQCPPGFTEEQEEDNRNTCHCHPRIKSYTQECDIQTGTILYDGNFWVGYDNDAITDGLILHQFCPFDYCLTDPFLLDISNFDTQCNHNRRGFLCGNCSDGLSLVLGSSSCEKCHDDFLALLLFFALAGVMLVAFLLILNLTVASGTINGLVFYVNIVAASDTFVFPSKSNAYLDTLKVFIAWVNLDFGIKSCFYDGMDQYAKTWLLYVFPVYIWVLIGLVFLASHFSTRAAKLFGSNPVAVLATLFLLSYTNFLNTIIEAFSWARLEYPGGTYKYVWWYDGNVPFLDVNDGRHLGLWLASFLCLMMLSIPYTVLLFTSQWLQIKSHWKVLSWLNKPQLRSFLDAYHAPYKPRHRYWTGLLLLIRLAILLTLAFSRSANRGLVYLVIEILVFIALMWAWTNGGIYKKRYLNILEAFFFLNLGILMASNYYIESELHGDQTAQRAATSILLTTAFIAFVGIVTFHVYLKIVATKHINNFLRNMMVKKKTSQPTIELQESAENREKITTNYVSLREPLLDI